jgi:dolichol kinase
VRQVLELPAYRRLLAAYVLNELAWATGSLALAVFVYRRTGSAIGTMVFFLCSQFLPALCAPLLAARLDQRPARRVLPALYAFECLAFLVLALLASQIALAAVLVLAALDGVAALTGRALTRAVTVAVISPPGLLREGNALTNAAFSVCFMAGPALGGAIVAAGGTGAALATGSALFALIAVKLASAGSLPASASQPTPSAGRLRAALAYAASNPQIRTLLALRGTALAFFTMSIPVAVVYAERSVHAGAGGYGALLTAWGAGATAGSALYVRWRARPSAALITLGAAALGFGFLVMALAPAISVALVGALLGGVGNGIESIAAATALQESVEPARMALTLTLNESLSQAIPGVGILLGGAIAALAGPRAALGAAAGGALLVALAVSIVLPSGSGGGKPPRADPAEPPERAPAVSPADIPTR